ncbi:MAG: seg [Parcubacteria group bacterium]|nr:seg [Parcubacteria group bacterium]
MPDKGQDKDISTHRNTSGTSRIDEFVLDKGIFSNVFEKDIRRVYIYKKSERLAKALYLVAPAFVNSPSLRNRVDIIAVGLVDAAALPLLTARAALSRELLALSSVLSIARVGGLLSPMNADLIAYEAHALLQEISAYEEPRLFLDETPTLAALFKSVSTGEGARGARESARPQASTNAVKDTQGQIKDNAPKPERREAILSILRGKGPSYIKDISTVIRDISEKTIQRELSALVEEGVVERTGERRWTTYSLSA